MPVLILAALQWLATRLFVSFVIQLIFSFGIAFVTYSGFQKALELLKDSVVSTLGHLPESAYNLLMIAGVGDGLSYLFGAFSFYAAMKATKRIKFAFGGDK